MILSDREILAALARGALRITPQPSSEALSSTAVDLTLAKELVLMRKQGVAGATILVCPADPNFRFDELVKGYGEQIVISPDGYVFKSGSFMLGWTNEKI